MRAVGLDAAAEGELLTHERQPRSRRSVRRRPAAADEREAQQRDGDRDGDDSAHQGDPVGRRTVRGVTLIGVGSPRETTAPTGGSVQLAVHPVVAILVPLRDVRDLAVITAAMGGVPLGLALPTGLGRSPAPTPIAALMAAVSVVQVFSNSALMTCQRALTRARNDALPVVLEQLDEPLRRVVDTAAVAPACPCRARTSRSASGRTCVRSSPGRRCRRSGRSPTPGRSGTCCPAAFTGSVPEVVAAVEVGVVVLRELLDQVEVDAEAASM